MTQAQSENGFTLIELMVVILIIAVLVTIAVPVYQQAKAGAQRATCQANLRIMAGAMEAWKAEHSDINYPSNVTAISTLASDGYVKAAPVCPSGGTYPCTGGGGTTSPIISCSLAATDGHTYP